MTIALTVALVLLIGWAILHTRRKLRQGGGCCPEHEQTERKVRPVDRDNSHYSYLVSLRIGGMTCQNCATKVENALNRQEGMLAKVSIDSHTAKVHCKTEPDEAAIRRIIREAGYVVTEYKVIQPPA